LVSASAPLVLEGLEILEVCNDRLPSEYHSIITSSKAIYLANCRLLQEGPFREGLNLISTDSTIQVRNCELYGRSACNVTFHNHVPTHFVMDNCLALGNAGVAYLNYMGGSNNVSLKFTRNTIATPWGYQLAFNMDLDRPLAGTPGAAKPIRFEASSNVFDMSASMLLFEQIEPFRGKAKWPETKDPAAVFVPLVSWSDQSNLYRPGASSIKLRGADGEDVPFGPTDTMGWDRFWGQTKTESVEGRIRYSGGDLFTRGRDAPEKLTPNDFRLRADSAGYRADKDGKDLGADVDLVGPGPAYERWKKTPEYQQWLKDTKQATKAEAPKPAPKAFVVLTGKGVAVREFDSLAEAVKIASDGDTIEIRGNGPFVSKPISIGKTELTIRAGAGFRPVIKPSPEGVETASFLVTDAALVLEGLEIPMFPEDQDKSGRSIQSNKGPLRAANCKFHGGIWMTQSPVCEFRNCEFLIGRGPWSCFAQQISSGARILFENCLCRSNGHALHLFYATDRTDDVSMQITRSTFASKNAPLALSLQSPMPAGMDGPKAMKPIRLEVSRSVFDSTGILAFGQQQGFTDKAGVLPPVEADAMLLRLLEWRGEWSVYPAGSNSVHWHANFKAQPPRGPKGLDEWKKFSGSKEADSRDGRPRFHGGNILARADLDQLTPDDFRLRPDSDGYRAGKDGKDLGADVDLVGPGPAYERWKKTPEYQQWLKDTKQAAKAEPSEPESKPPVLLTDDAVKRELARWQGEWENAGLGRLIIKGDRWAWHPKDGPEVVSTIKIVEITDKMTHVLLLNTGLDAKVRTIQVILRVDGDTLHNCGTPGSIRPTAFANQPGYLYAQWKRVTMKQP
jgi:hypothetical protein